MQLRTHLLSFLLLMISGYNFFDKNDQISNRPVYKSSVVIQPLGNVNHKNVEELRAYIKVFIGSVTVNDPLEFPESLYFSPNKRYRADKTIKWLSTMAQKGEIYLGITTLDISTTKGDYKDFGILGLGYKPGNACVISSFRLKDKNKIPILAIHELGHTFGLPHCPEKGCYMKDAEGKDHTSHLNGFCKKCTIYLTDRGWSL